MTTQSESQSAKKSVSAPVNFPQYAPPKNPAGIPIQPDPKFHKPLFSLARKMMKKTSRPRKTSQDVHITHRKKPKWY